MLYQIGTIGINKQTGTSPENRTVITSPDFIDAHDVNEAIALHCVKNSELIKKSNFDKLEIFTKN